MGSAGSAVPTRATTLTRADGRFLLEGLASGTLSVTVAAKDHHGRIVAGLSIPESGDAAAVEVELTPVGTGEEPKMELAGIGVTLAPKGDVLVVGTVFPKGGAEEAGLLPGDEVLEVDGKPVKALGYEGSIHAIRGPEGTTVVLTLRRAGAVTQVPVRRKLVPA
jgi:S1-C subfamily serine protease